MSLPDEPRLTGEILEESSALSVSELTRLIAVEERHIVEWVQEGVINVLEIDAAEWRFSGAQLRRARIALRLERDLGVNAPAWRWRSNCWRSSKQLRRARRMGRS